MRFKYIALLSWIPLGIHPSFALDIPLQIDSQRWQTLSYQNIDANSVTQTIQGLRISVDASASPLIYVFDQPLLVKQVHVAGEIHDLPSIPIDIEQGANGADDFVFRLGLVLEGDKTLGFAQKLVAAQWVKTLFELAAAASGIDHVLFLNLANPPDISWENREHPKSKGLFREQIVQHVSAGEAFEMNYSLPDDKRVLALWISADGDDTHSQFALNLNKISLN